MLAIENDCLHMGTPRHVLGQYNAEILENINPLQGTITKQERSLRNTWNLLSRDEHVQRIEIKEIFHGPLLNHFNDTTALGRQGG